MFYKGSHTEENFSYSYFASDHVIQNIKENIPEVDRQFLMDATFKVCPLGSFYQFLVIYIGYCGQAVPFIYVLMSRKTEECYKHLFVTLKKTFPLNGKSFMTDFELAIRNALRSVYPEVSQYTCWFHFCQAAKRKCSKFPSFVNDIKNNENIKKAYYKLLALPLLPPNHIVSCFQMVKSELTDVKSAKKFLDYFDKQWLKQVKIICDHLMYGIRNKPQIYVIVLETV